MPTSDALKLAPRDSGLDLIEISPSAKPPVARIMSFDKYRYEQEKLEKKQRQANKNTDLKQVQISARAALNDLQVKLAKLEEFLNEGHPVEIIMRLKGREKANKDFAGQKLTAFMKMIVTEYKIISPPKYAGNGFSAQITKKE
jgi:translation initiation factor IF-3